MISEPCTDKKKAPESFSNPNYRVCLNKDEFIGIQPRFSEDYSRLAYIGKDQSFTTHSGCYQLKYLNSSDFMDV